MTGSILNIKISIPPQDPGLLERPELLGGLEKRLQSQDGFARQLTLVSAPAGFGKTTLARSLLAGKESCSAWYSLDQGDNERERFWLYLVSAIKSVYKDLGRGTEEILRSSSLGSDLSLEREMFLTPLLNDLFSLDQQIFLVLDDYHVINNSTIHQDMVFFIENLPPHFHLVITTRSEPPWPLARWRARGKMVEARQKDLRFTKDEAMRLFEEKKALKLNDHQVQALYNKTEGWITGLQLAAISLSEITNPGQFIESFTGSHRHVFHFLIEEVFTRQPEAVREFLLQTSVLKRFSASLCRAVTELEDSAELMAELERKNMFLIALDEEGTWYRYHPLFADLLLHQLKRTMPEKIELLHERAARWLVEAGEPGEAIRHALEGNNLELAARTLDNNIETLSQTEGVGLLNECLELIPSELLVEFPYLAVNKAWFYMVHKGMEEAGAIINLAEQVEAGTSFSDDAEKHKFAGTLAVVKAYYHIYKQNFPDALDNAEKALGLLPAKSSYWRSRVGIISGDARLFSGNPKDAYRYYLDAHRDNESFGNNYLSLNTGFKVATTLNYLGRLEEAEKMTYELISIARINSLDRLPRCGLLWTLLGDCLREKGNLEEAERFVERGLSLSEPEKPSHGWNYLYRIALDYSKREYELAMDRIKELEQLHREVTLPDFILIPTAAWKALLLLACKKTDEAREVLEQAGIKENDNIPGGRERCYLALARVLLKEDPGSQQQVEKILEQVQTAAQAGEHRQLLIETLLSRTLLEDNLGSSKVAEDTLLQALQLGEKSGFYQVFIDQGQELIPVYKRVISRGEKGSPANLKPALLALAGSVLSALTHLEDRVSKDTEPGLEGVVLQEKQSAAAGASAPALGNSALHENLVEELSSREIEILSLFSQGLSNQQVAQKLFLSPGTVKWHASNIYGKLGVRGRLQAVALGRNLKLIQ